MQPASITAPRAVHVPALPPSQPAFQVIIASVARVIAEQGPRAASELCRASAENIATTIERAASGDRKTLDRMTRQGIDAFDLNELEHWLRSRAHELLASVQG
jgi:hypothetical protein